MMTLEKKNKGWGGAPPWAPPSKAAPSSTAASTPASTTSAAKPPAGGYSASAAAGATGARGHAGAAAVTAAPAGGPAAPQAGASPEELLQYHADLTRYHQQAMAHHFGMMYHHHKKAAEVYLNFNGPEYDFRVPRPKIPEHPKLPDEWEEEQEQLYALGEPAYLPYPPPKPEPTATGGSNSPLEDGGGHIVQVEDDPRLTADEQSWLNQQLDAAIMREVEKQLTAEELAQAQAEEAAGDDMIPEMICAGDEPSAEEMERFIDQIDAAQAWRAPIASVGAAAKKAAGGDEAGAATDTDADAPAPEVAAKEETAAAAADAPSSEA